MIHISRIKLNFCSYSKYKMDIESPVPINNLHISIGIWVTNGNQVLKIIRNKCLLNIERTGRYFLDNQLILRDSSSDGVYNFEKFTRNV